MKTPNKIYLEVLPYSNSKEVFKDVLKTKRTFEDDIEYIRTDAFIEKACEWIKENITNNHYANSVLVRNGCVTLGMLVEDFKNYMKGEAK